MSEPITPIPNDKAEKEQIKKNLNGLFNAIYSFFFKLVDLRPGVDKQGTITNIKNNKRMRGANAWLLMCSIMIASLGLDLNSPAVIIGAMLISPLMSPILGVGLAFAINDRTTLIISLQHFGIAIAIALFTSTIYFLVTPFGDFTSEISGRTYPTLLDAAVALFWGVAGIISGSRSDKSNAIPGVAIATALMPPLCVTGFGIANLILHGITTESFSGLTNLNNWEILFNSFYLFFLNATLVALATFLIVRLLKFPRRSFSEIESRNTIFLLFVFSMVILIPSFLILRTVLADINETRAIKLALQDCFGDNQKYIDDWEKIEKDSTADLIVKVYGSAITNNLSAYKTQLEEKLPYNIELIPTTEIDLGRFNNIAATVSDYEDFKDSLLTNTFQQPVKERDLKINALNQQIAYLTSDSLLQSNIEKEALALYPDYLEDFQVLNTDSTKTPDPLMMIIKWKQRPSTTIERRLESLVKVKTDREEVAVSYMK